MNVQENNLSEGFYTTTQGTYIIIQFNYNLKLK